MTDSPPPASLGSRLGRAFVRLIVFLVVLALAGAVLWLISERNARTYSLEIAADRLVVRKGRMLPTGSDPWRPADPRLADAYAPIPLEGVSPDPSLVGKPFADRDELDRALFELLTQAARPHLKSGKPQAVTRAVYLLQRAAKLGGATEEQRSQLAMLQADIAFFQARLKLEEAREAIVEALNQLELASKSKNPQARAAARWAAWLAPLMRGVDQLMREELAADLPPVAPLTEPEPGEDSLEAQGAEQGAPDAPAVTDTPQGLPGAPDADGSSATGAEPPPPSAP